MYFFIRQNIDRDFFLKIMRGKIIPLKILEYTKIISFDSVQ